MPPGLGAPPAKLGPASTPQANPGGAQSGVAGIHAAIDLLQKALPGLPMGTPIHTAALKATSELTKAVGETHADNAQKIQTFMNAIRGSANNPMQQAMQRVMPAQAPNMPQPGG